MHLLDQRSPLLRRDRPHLPLLCALLGVFTLSGCTVLLDFEECVTNASCAAGAQCVEGVCLSSQSAIRVSVRGVIAQSTTWTKDNIYVLENIVSIPPSVTLTIEPGTTVLGDRNSALVARSGGRIIAKGTREEPIVFTSAKPAGERLAGDWGGVAVLGKARVNRENFQLNIFTDESDALVGGDDDTWNCGTFEYVRVEFAGGKIKGEEALNGLTLAGCGSQTKVEYVQVHFGEDDGVEIFGGTVDLRHILVSRSQDDGFDIDTAWRGTAQFLVVIQDASGDNAIEVDNLGEDPTALPRTDFSIYNYTLIGADDVVLNQRAVTFKAGGVGLLSHGIIMGQGQEAVDVVGQESGRLAAEGEIEVLNTLFFNIGEDGTSYFPTDETVGTQGDDDIGFIEDVYFSRSEAQNTFGQDPALENPYDLLNPGLRPTNLDVVTGTEIPTPPAPFLATANYLGAFTPGVDPWTEDWTSFPGS